MKLRYTLNVLLLSVLLIPVTSCLDGKDDYKLPIEPPAFKFYFIESDSTFNCSEGKVEVDITPNPFGGGLLSISGTSNSGKSVNLVCNFKYGDYKIDSVPSSNIITYFKDGDLNVCTNGKIAIINIDTTAKKISGEFYGSGNGFNIRRGYFTYVSY